MFAEKHKWARDAVGAIDKVSDAKRNVVKLKRKAGNMARKYTRLTNKPLTAIRNAAAISGVASTAIAGGGSAAGSSDSSASSGFGGGMSGFGGGLGGGLQKSRSSF